MKNKKKRKKREKQKKNKKKKTNFCQQIIQSFCPIPEVVSGPL